MATPAADSMFSPKNCVVIIPSRRSGRVEAAGCVVAREGENSEEATKARGADDLVVPLNCESPLAPSKPPKSSRHFAPSAKTRVETAIVVLL